MYSTFIKTPDEFSFKECYTFLNRSTDECLHTASDNKIRKLLKISGKLFLIEISSGTALKNKIRVNFLNSVPLKQEVLFVKEFVNDWFDLSTDIRPFYTFAKKDKLLNKIVKMYFGLRLIGIPDLFEALTWAIIGQQINLTFAFKLKRKFVEKYGEMLKFENNTYFIYPEFERISKIQKADLLKLQFSKQKAEYVIETAKAFSENSISKKFIEELSNSSLNEAKDKLCEIRGIGNWTANYALMKCLRNPEAFPIEDVGLHNAIKKALNLESKPSIDDIIKLSGKWKGWHSYSVFYLWRSLLPD